MTSKEANPLIYASSMLVVALDRERQFERNASTELQQLMARTQGKLELTVEQSMSVLGNMGNIRLQVSLLEQYTQGNASPQFYEPPLETSGTDYDIVAAESVKELIEETDKLNKFGEGWAF